MNEQKYLIQQNSTIYEQEAYMTVPRWSTYSMVIKRGYALEAENHTRTRSRK
jgi:hypothetical protein